jgi:hypothetical protein
MGIFMKPLIFFLLLLSAELSANDDNNKVIFQNVIY